MNYCLSLCIKAKYENDNNDDNMVNSRETMLSTKRSSHNVCCLVFMRVSLSFSGKLRVQGKLVARFKSF